MVDCYAPIFFLNYEVIVSVRVVVDTDDFDFSLTPSALRLVKARRTANIESKSFFAISNSF